MRLNWQCPICYAEIGDKSHAEMITCPYCGTLLIVYGEKKKFYPVKKGRGWHYFPKIYLQRHDGYMRLGSEELFFRFSSGKWYLHRGNEIYELVKESKAPCECSEETILTEIWGDSPIKIIPEQNICLGFCEGRMVIKTSQKEYLFMKIY